MGTGTKTLSSSGESIRSLRRPLGDPCGNYLESPPTEGLAFVNDRFADVRHALQGHNTMAVSTISPSNRECPKRLHSSRPDPAPKSSLESIAYVSFTAITSTASPAAAGRYCEFAPHESSRRPSATRLAAAESCCTPHSHRSGQTGGSAERLLDGGEREYAHPPPLAAQAAQEPFSQENQRTRLNDGFRVLGTKKMPKLDQHRE
jgi:hypothetical protein